MRTLDSNTIQSDLPIEPISPKIGIGYDMWMHRSVGSKKSQDPK